MTVAELPRISVFLSSPGDVGAERDIAERAILRAAGAWKQYLSLEVKRWERDHYEAVRSFQAAIGEMGQYDIFIAILWKRIGSSLPVAEFHRPDGSAYESGTVFEIETAIESGTKHGRPKVFVFRSSAPVLFPAETAEQDHRQYQQLQAWWGRTFRDAEGRFPRGFQTYATLDAFEASLEALLEKLLREAELIPAGPAWDIASKGSPYPGLVPYDASHSAVFFGRALAVASAMEELQTAARRALPSLFVIGPSGSGKSSLVRAGLVPHFVDHAIQGVDFWRHVLLEPAQDPLLVLAQRLYAADALPELEAGPQPKPEQFAALARTAPEAAADAVRWALERAGNKAQRAIAGGRIPVGRLLLNLDQLETVLDHPDRGPIAKLLRALVEGETTWLVATLRSDRYPDFQLDPDFLHLRRRGVLFDLPPPGPSEIADVIKGPARAANLVFEEREEVPLSASIRAAVTDADALPLLQMTLKRLFEERRGNVLTYAAYEDMGGLEGAIAAHAEDVYAAVAEDSRAKLDGILRSLVADIDDSGRLTIATPRRSVIATDAPARALVDKMIEARLLVSAEGNLRVAHEALLRHWKRAAASPALQPEAIRLRRQIEPTLQVWNQTHLNADLLQPGTALAAAESITRRHPGAFPPELDAYVARSAKAARDHIEAESRRARRRTYVASAVAVVLALLTLVSLRLYGEANGDFELALLTKADRLLVEQKPTQALVLAGALGTSVLDTAAQWVGLIDQSSEKSVRIRTIAEIASRAAAVPLRTLRHSQAATAGALSADGTRYAVGYANGEVIVAAADGRAKEIHRAANSGRIWSMQLSQDGKWLASASADDLTLWNLETNEITRLCDAKKSGINAIALDPSGRYLAWATKDGRVSVRALASGHVEEFSEHARWAIAVDFSADGGLLASGGDDGRIVVRDTRDWAVVATIPTGRVDLFSLSFSRDGKRIATASLGGAADIWSVRADHPEATGVSLVAPADRRWKIKFSPDGKLLALASWQGTITFWDADTYQYRGTIDGNDHRVNDISFSSDGARLLSVVENGTARIWDTRSVRPMFDTVKGDEREVIAGTYSRDGSKFVGGGRDGIAKLFAIDNDGNWHLRCRIDHKNWVIGAAISADGGEVATVGIAEGNTANEDVIKIWQTDTCQLSPLSVNPEHVYVQSIAFSPTRREIAWATRDGEVHVSQLGEDVTRTTLPKFHKAPVDAIDFSPDGKLLVSGDQTGKMAVWDLERGTLSRELIGHHQGLYTIKFLAGGKRIASAGNEERILVWDITRERRAELVQELALPGGANRLALNADSSMLAIGTDARYVAIWSTQSWRKIFQLNTLVGVRSVYGFNSRNGDLAFDGEDGFIRILPKAAQAAAAAPTTGGVLNGMDVIFDQIPVNVAPERDAVELPPPAAACPAR